MKPVNVKVSLTSMTSYLLIAASLLLGFSSVMSTEEAAAASPIDADNTTTVGGATTPTDTMSNNNTSLNTTTSSTPITSNVELEEEPFAVGRYSPVSVNMINETQQLQIVFEGGTTITLPNSTETITTRDTGEGLITSLPGGGVIRGQIQMSTEEGSESATVDLTEYFLDESPTAINLAYFSTNSTGMLAPLNNMIAVSLDEEQPNGDVVVRLFEWKVGGGGGGAPNLGSNNDNTTSNVNDTTTTTATATEEQAITGLSEGQLSPEEEQQAVEEETVTGTPSP
ncbi:MAG: hypothetical protein QOK66_01745 [Nitrososphaeraceae archaeon]|nr:hypothetical protein [Nitrososphaeraceae archaeon]